MSIFFVLFVLTASAPNLFSNGLFGNFDDLFAAKKGIVLKKGEFIDDARKIILF